MRRVLACAIALAVAAHLGACSEERKRAPAGSGAPSDAQRYTVRGEILRLPRPGSAELVVRHEAVPAFVDASGRRAPMEAMVMPFPLAPSASTQGLSVGDKVAFELVVDWAKPSLEIRRLERLPEGTVLQLR